MNGTPSLSQAGPAVPRKIRLLYVLNTLAIGGAEQLISLIAGRLPADRFHVIVCTLFSRGEQPEPLADELRAAGIRTVQLAMTRWRDLTTIRQFWTLIKEERIDMIHTHTVPADFWGALLTKLTQPIPILYTRHDVMDRRGLIMRAQRLILDHVLADKITSISDVVTRYLTSVRKIPMDRIVQIPNPVDTERFHPRVSGAAVRHELGIPPDAVVIGNVSRFEKRKGYDYFLDIAATMVPKHPQLYFLMVGHGVEKEHLVGRIAAANLGKRVFLTDPRRDIPEVLSAMDCFLFLSLWGEGFGIAVIEAMAAGKPVVAANTGPAGELLRDGVTGFLPAPEVWVPETERLDIRPIVTCLNQLIADPARRSQIGLNAREATIVRFSLPVVLARTQTLYESIYREFYG